MSTWAVLKGLKGVQDETDALMGCQAGRYEGQTQLVFAKPHQIKDAFDAGRIAVDEKKSEEIVEAMMNSARCCLVAVEGKTYHVGEIARERVADDGDGSYCDDGYQREGNGVVA